MEEERDGNRIKRKAGRGMGVEMGIGILIVTGDGVRHIHFM